MSFVSVESPTSLVIMTKRDKAMSFYDKLGVVGGTFGLFVGMSLLSFGEIAILLLELIFLEIWKTPLEMLEDSGGKSYDKRMKKVDQSITVSLFYDLPANFD